MEQPDGIIITISAGMLKERGYKNWLKNFLRAMNTEDRTYWMRQGVCPKKDILYVYLCIGGYIRFRGLFIMSDTDREIMFDDGRKMYAKAWVVLGGPVVRAPRKQFPMKGFRGFRYTEKLF